MTEVPDNNVLSKEDLDLIIRGLGDRPYNEVYRVMIKLKRLRKEIRNYGPIEINQVHEAPSHVSPPIPEAIPEYRSSFRFAEPTPPSSPEEPEEKPELSVPDHEPKPELEGEPDSEEEFPSFEEEEFDIADTSKPEGEPDKPEDAPTVYRSGRQSINSRSQPGLHKPQLLSKKRRRK